jgi:hypothetical protein
MRTLSKISVIWLPLVAFLAACGGAEQSSSKDFGNRGTGDTHGNASGGSTGGPGASGTVGGGGAGGGGSTTGTTGTTGSGGSFDPGGIPPVPPGGAGGGAGTGSGGGGGVGGTGIGGTGGTVGTGGTAGTGGTGGSTGGTGGGPVIQPGSLTAGAWDDNRNFDRFLRYRAELAAQQVPGLLPIADADYASAREEASAPLRPHDRLDISFVIDTTGSMSDELQFLQTEFLAISQRISDLYPYAEPRWSLVLYRDVGDEYVVRSFDFDGDAQAFQARLAAQRAGGGGDIPEAPERGFEEMVSFSWRMEPNVARLAFWVADAPHHAQNAVALGKTILQSRVRGIHVYPVASSGVDEFTELTMRISAQLTGGRYLFLTNDSGLGNSHKEPSIPCYFVTRLDNAMLRMVDIELSGIYHEPAAPEIIRTGGNPQNGACALQSGESAIVF